MRYGTLEKTPDHRNNKLNANDACLEKIYSGCEMRLPRNCHRLTIYCFGQSN